MKVAAINMIKFKKYTSSRYEILVKMFLEFYEEDPSTCIVSEENIKKTLAEYAKYPTKGEILLFEKDDKIIGYSILMFYWSNEYATTIVNIDEFFVAKTHRGEGIGTAFMQFLFNDYRDVLGNNPTVFELEVTPKNKRALSYYQKLGFVHYKNAQLQKIVAKN